MKALKQFSFRSNNEFGEFDEKICKSILSNKDHFERKVKWVSVDEHQPFPF